MVKLSLAALVITVALPSLAVAHPPPEGDYDEPAPTAEPDDSPAFNMFGFAMGVGGLPIRGADNLAFSIGLSVEHPVFKKTRVFGEYDWLWLQRRDPRAGEMMNSEQMVPRPDEHGSGHRTSLGLRRELIGKSGGSTHAFIDGELGASIALVNDNMTGVEVLPAGFAGIRLGYDLYARRDDSPSATFETGLLLRIIALRDGVGMSFGVGMYWGN